MEESDHAAAYSIVERTLIETGVILARADFDAMQGLAVLDFSAAPSCVHNTRKIVLRRRYLTGSTSCSTGQGWHEPRRLEGRR